MQTCNAYAYIQTPSHARTRTHAHAQTYTRAHMHTTHGTISKPPSLFLSQGDGESRCGPLYKYSLAHYVQFRDCGRMRPATAGACAPRLRALNLVPIATRMQMDNTTTAERQHEITCVRHPCGRPSDAQRRLHRLVPPNARTLDALAPATADRARSRTHDHDPRLRTIIAAHDDQVLN